MRIALAALAATAFAALAPAASALTVEAKIAPEFQHKLEKTYGVREAKVLTDDLASTIQRQFDRQHVKADHVVVTIVDARPNRPTFQQLSDRPGLDPIGSIGTGGADISGVAYDASGKEIGSFKYDWYESDITQVIGYATWTDANWVFDRFARRFADKLT